LLGGLGLPGPPLAGRFPTYLLRQLYEAQSGARSGDPAVPILTVDNRLTRSDMIDLAAYGTSFKP
jgi:cytochrome c553